MNKKNLLVGALGLAGLAFSVGAHAAACGVSSMSTSDVTINSVEASDCLKGGIPGNNPSGTWSVFGGTFNQVGSNLNSGESFESEAISAGGNNGTLRYGSDPSLSGAPGDWYLTWIGGPWVLDLVMVVKQGNTYGAYLFSDLSLSPANGSYTDGYYRVGFPTTGSNKGISHLALYYGGLESSIPPNEIPAPAPIVLMGLAFAAAAFARQGGKRG